MPKNRVRILIGPVAVKLYKTINVYCGRLGCEVIELNIQNDHVHLLVAMPPKLSVSKLLGTVKGKTEIQIFRQNPKLIQYPYWGNNFWIRRYCVDAVGIDEKNHR